MKGKKETFDPKLFLAEDENLKLKHVVADLTLEGWPAQSQRPRMQAHRQGR